MLKRIVLILALLTALPAAADSVQDTVAQLGQQTAQLAQQMRPAGVNLTWGQDVAASDMARLAKVSGEINALFADDKEHTYDELTPLVSELQTAATRVKGSAQLSVLDEVGQQQAVNVVDKATLVRVEIDSARRLADEQRAARRTQYNASLGWGMGYGGGWGIGYPGWGWGFPGYRSGFGFGVGFPIYGGGRRCR